MNVMLQAYLTTYIASCVVCALLLLYMTVRMDRNLGSDLEINVFRQMVGYGLTTIVVVIIEVIMLLGIRGGVSQTAMLILHWADLVCTAMAIFMVYVFITLRLNANVRERAYRLKRVLISLPIVVLIIIDTMSIKTGWVYVISADGVYARGPYFAVQAVILMFYCVLGLVTLAVASFKKPESRPVIRQLILFLICPIVGGIMQMLFQRVPFTIYSFTLGVFMLFVSAASVRIETDALTGAYNRDMAVRYFKNKYKTAQAHPFYVYVADIDDFKQINDTYGHLAGDRALIAMTDAMRRVKRKYPDLFISRYGGDEFLMALDEDVASPVTILREFRTALADIEHEALGFEMTASVGYSLATGNLKDVRMVFDAADRELYKIKNKRKTAQAGA